MLVGYLADWKVQMKAENLVACLVVRSVDLMARLKVGSWAGLMASPMAGSKVY